MYIDIEDTQHVFAEMFGSGRNRSVFIVDPLHDPWCTVTIATVIPDSCLKRFDSKQVFHSKFQYVPKQKPRTIPGRAEIGSFIVSLARGQNLKLAW